VQNGGGGARGGGVKSQYGFRPAEPAGFGGGGGRGDATVDIPLDTMNVSEAPAPSLYYLVACLVIEGATERAW
jgi:hypothetical protein